MFSTTTILASVLALNLTAASTTMHGEPTLQARPTIGGLFGGQGFLGFGGGVKVAPGDCLGVDIAAGASCGVLTGAAALLECDPLSVEAACLAELGADSGVDAFVGCTAALTAHCQAEVNAGGALFCDGLFVGADTCLGAIEVDVEIDAEACVEVELAEDAELNTDVAADLCLELELAADCSFSAGAVCHAKCEPAAVEAACEGELDGRAGELHAYAACQAERMAQCHTNCDAAGSLFCGGDVYAGAELCLDIGLGIGIGF